MTRVVKRKRYLELNRNIKLNKKIVKIGFDPRKSIWPGDF